MGPETATSTYAAHANAQLTKCTDDAGNEIALPHICDKKDRLWGSNPQPRHIRPRPLRNLQNGQTMPEMKLHIHTFALTMPPVGIEPATSTFAAQTITQLTKSADDAKTTNTYPRKKALRS